VTVLELCHAGKHADAVAMQEASTAPVPIETVLAYAHSLEHVGRARDAVDILRSLHDASPCLPLAEKLASAMCRTGRADLDLAARLRHQYPDSGVIRAAESELLLLSGSWARGFACFRDRWHVSKGNSRRQALACPEWAHGEQFPGRLFVVGEQGLGEQILFSRYLRDLQPATVLVDPRLIPLLRRTYPQHSYLDWDSIPATDQNDRAVDLGGLATDLLEAYPLQVNLPRAESYARDLRASFPGRTVVGLSWASYRQSMADAKSIPVADLDRLVAAYPCVTLQYGQPKDDLARWDAAGLPVYAIDRLDLTNDLDGVAALAASVDVVVTCSNTVAHIAGAIGKRAILLAPQRFNLWHWGQGARTHWYPSVEIVRAATWSEAVGEAMDRIKSPLQSGAE
jgi:hypothetical protein